MSKLGKQLFDDYDDDDYGDDWDKSRRIDGIDRLYGGNFQEWQKQMSDTFIAKGRSTQAYPSISHIDEYGVTHYHTSTFGDIHDIFSTIEDRVMRRVPDCLEFSIGRLYACLEKLCEPFRLLDLPAELRVKVFENVVRSDVKITVEDGIRHKVPALAQTSQQLRQEVLPVYFSSNIFASHEVLDTSDVLSIAQATAASISSWQHNALRSSAKHLRRFDLKVSASRDDPQRNGRNPFLYAETVLKLRFHRNRGLWMETAPNLYDESKKRLEEMVALAEAERKEHSFTGESILSLLHLLCNWSSGPRARRYDWLELRLREERS